MYFWGHLRISKYMLFLKNIKKCALILCTPFCCLLKVCGSTTKEEETAEVPEEEDAEIAEVADTTEEDAEVIGDVDITRDITVNDCQEIIVGSDVVLDYGKKEKMQKSTRAAWKLFGRDDIKVLMPSDEFITSLNNATVTETDTINVNIIIDCLEQDIEDKTDDEKYDFGRYIVTKFYSFGEDIARNWFGIQYNIYDTESDTILRMSLTINKMDFDEVEYVENFIKEYISRFISGEK